MAERGELVPDDDPRNIRDEGFEALSRAEVQEMARRGHAVQRAKRRARKLAELAAYTEAHKELAGVLLGAKMTLLDGLVEEMLDPDSGELDTKRLDKDRMKLLVSLIDQMEKRAYGAAPTKAEAHVTVDVKAIVASLKRDLTRPDD